MKKGTIILVLLGVVMLLAVFTNPNEARHKEVLRSTLNAHLQKSLSEKSSGKDSGLEKAGQALGAILGGAVIKGMVENMVSTDNYLLFSTTKITFDGETRVVGYGIFGNVYISDKLNQALEEGLLEE